MCLLKIFINWFFFNVKVSVQNPQPKTSPQSTTKARAQKSPATVAPRTLTTSSASQSSAPSVSSISGSMSSAFSSVSSTTTSTSSAAVSRSPTTASSSSSTYQHAGAKPRVVSSKPTHTDDDSSDRCNICKRPYTSPQNLNKCNHRFCKHCIEEYFMKNEPKCPTCGKISLIRGCQPAGGTMESSSNTIRSVDIGLWSGRSDD